MERNKTFLVTCWVHPDCGQALVFPGSKKETRALAIQYMVADPKAIRALKGNEEQWSNKQLKEFTEFADENTHDQA